MGKNSLLKSTTKSIKSPSKKKDEELAAKTKAAPKAKAAPKTKAAPTPKAAVKAKAKPKTPAKKAAPPKKEISVKDLIQKKFDTWKPEKIFTVSHEEKDRQNFAAPPFFSGTKE